MDQLELDKGKPYQLKITSLRYTNKMIGAKNGFPARYVFEVTGFEKGKKEGGCQYLHSSEDQTTIPLVIGVIQWVKCVLLSPMNTATIEPTDPPNTLTAAYQESKIDPYAGISKERDPALVYKPQCNSINISGLSITFAMAYAKDLKIAEIAKREEGFVGDADIEDVIKWGLVINAAICEKVTAG